MSTSTGRALRVDLSTGRTSIDSLPARWVHDFVGGRGLGMRWLLETGPADGGPLDADTPLIFAPGVLTGSNAQGVGRWVVVTHGPLTGGVARAVCGGNFGAALKSAGFDLLVVTGASADPVYLRLGSDGVDILPARDLWGLDTRETQTALAGRHGRRAQVACIGPAGERLVRYAAIVHGRRTASRGGVGAVMGSKLLKAVAVSGRGGPRPADPVRFAAAVERQVAILKTHPRRLQLSNLGTLPTLDTALWLGCLPALNFRYGSLTGLERLHADAFARHQAGTFGCYACLTRCGQSHRAADGPYAGVYSEGPEYETLWAFGPQVGNVEPGAILAAEATCDLQGLDTISAGNAIGFACELFERGILTLADTDGLDLGWGNHQAMLALLERIARRQGLGALLGEGVRRAAASIGRGAERLAMHVKGMELPAYDPRAVKGYGLSYATSAIGGSHMYGRPRQELYGGNGPESVNRFIEEGKGHLIAHVQAQQAADEIVVLCNFGNSGLSAELLGQLLEAGTGRDDLADPSRYHRIGERILAAERLFNTAAGFTRADDTLPERFFREPLLQAAEASGQVIGSLEHMLDEYYDALGYSAEGSPTPARLAELGLEGTGTPHSALTGR